MNPELEQEMIEEFERLLNQYIKRFGHTFSSLGMHPGDPHFYTAIAQMEEALNGGELVTEASLVVRGETAFDGE